MISLALSVSKSRSSSEIGDTAVPAGDGKGASAPFSAVLAALGPKAEGSNHEITAAAEPSVTGIVLPVPAETGKKLPGVAAIASGDRSAKVPDEDIEDKAGRVDTDAAAFAAPPPQLTPPAAMPDTPVSADPEPVSALSALSFPATPEAAPVASASLPAASEALPLTTGEDADRTARRAGPQPTQALLSPSATAEQPSLTSAEAPTQVKREGGEPAGSSKVAIHVAPEAAADRSSPRDATAETRVEPVKGRETRTEGLLLPKTAYAEPAPQAPSVSLAQGLQTESSQTSRTMESTKPAFQPEALQDLTRVVDRLVAARESLAPAAASLAVKHADFGELSLRFEQQRDGQLAVQLSSSDPDAHRAVAAAVNERGAAAAADSHTGGGQSQAQPRGLGAEREGTGSNTANGNAEKRDQPHQRRSAAHDPHGGSGAERSGIFA